MDPYLVRGERLQQPTLVGAAPPNFLVVRHVQSLHDSPESAASEGSDLAVHVRKTRFVGQRLAVPEVDARVVGAAVQARAHPEAGDVTRLELCEELVQRCPELGCELDVVTDAVVHPHFTRAERLEQPAALGALLTVRFVVRHVRPFHRAQDASSSTGCLRRGICFQC